MLLELQPSPQRETVVGYWSACSFSHQINIIKAMNGKFNQFQREAYQSAIFSYRIQQYKCSHLDRMCRLLDTKWRYWTTRSQLIYFTLSRSNALLVTSSDSNTQQTYTRHTYQSLEVWYWQTADCKKYNSKPLSTSAERQKNIKL